MAVNVPMLKGRMVEKQVRVIDLCNFLEISRAAFYRKLQNNGLTFTVGEIHAIGEFLHLTKDEMCDIFLF